MLYSKYNPKYLVTAFLWDGHRGENILVKQSWIIYFELNKKNIAHGTEPLPKLKNCVDFGFLLVFCQQTENSSLFPSGLTNRNLTNLPHHM